MKQKISFIVLFMIFAIFAFSTIVISVSLDTIDLKIDKTIVNPGEEVNLKLDFGENLSSFEFDIFYDNKLFEYITSDLGTVNDFQDKIKVSYSDLANTKENLNVIFKAKEGLTTSNPTEFLVKASNLKNSDGTVTFDDINVAIIKNVTVEPQYTDYILNLEHPEKVIAEKENDFVISYSAKMGRYYDKARFIAEVNTPDGASAKIIGIDENGTSYDIVDSGWGDSQGYKIGGKDIIQKLNVKGIFSKTGNYKVNLKLIDRENSDSIIAEKSFDIDVTEGIAVPPENLGTTENTQNQTISNEENKVKENSNDNKKQLPKTLPKAGNNLYLIGVLTIVFLIGTAIYYNKKK